MKKLILATIICFCSMIVYGQKSECKRMKNGNFTMSDPIVGDVLVERKGSKQIEYSKSTKVKIKLKVKWLNDCTYTLELKKVLENPNDVNLPQDMFLTVKIIEVKESSYVQQTTMKGSEMVFTSEMFMAE